MRCTNRRQSRRRFRNLDRFYGKRADQKVQRADGHRLLVWSYTVHFSELEPGRFDYVAAAYGGEVLAAEKVWEGARLDAIGGGELLLSRGAYDFLAGAAEPVEQKLALLKNMKLAAPLFSSKAP